MFKPMMIEKRVGHHVENVQLNTPEEAEKFFDKENQSAGRTVFAPKIERYACIETKGFHIAQHEVETWPSWMQSMVVSRGAKSFTIKGTEAELERFIAEFNALEKRRK
jgi:hypothetical protein